MSVVVALDRRDVIAARWEAARRNTNARLARHRDGTNTQAGLPGAIADEAGAVGEMAVARYTGLPHRFGADYDPDAPDVGRIEVRTRSLGSKHHDLRVYPTDADRCDYMVAASLEALGTHASVRLWGWAYPREAYDVSTDSSFAPHPAKGKARWHPVTLLRPMATLLEVIKQGGTR
jgi:hypothetical protein